MYTFRLSNVRKLIKLIVEVTRDLVCRDFLEANILWILVPFMLEMKKTLVLFLSLVTSTISKHP